MNASAPGTLDALEAHVHRGARALGRANLVNAYGHCSVRIDRERFLVCAPKPMGLIGADDRGSIVNVEGALPDGVLGEVRTHQQIYKRRADVRAIARTFPPNVLALSALRLTPKPRHGFGAYFAPAVPLWDDPLLLRTDEQAERLAEQLGPSRAIVMRGNGAIVVGAGLEEAVVLSWYLEDAARVELAVLSSGLAESAPLLTADQAEKRAVTAGGIYERMWAYLTRDESE